MMESTHPIFGEFTPFEGEVPAGFWSDFVGSMIDGRFSPEPGIPERAIVKSAVPEVGEHYFEWVSILEAVKAARDSFTMVELGAGFGRWTARAILAARQKGITDVHAILVEAEPLHVQWAKQHMINNKIDSFKVVEAAVGATARQELFLLRQPGQGDIAANSRVWYGQGIDPNAHTNGALRTVTEDTYCGRPIIDNGGGWGGINVEIKTLSSILDGIKRVDLLHMDIQGVEADVVEAEIKLLNKRVHFMCIGTHNHDIEDRIRTILTKSGWQKMWDFPCLTKTETPFGTIDFCDGVQTWRNPRFSGFLRGALSWRVSRCCFHHRNS